MTVAHLMGELLPPRQYRDWLAAYLPEGLGAVATPPVVPDRSDAQFCHLDGLSPVAGIERGHERGGAERETCAPDVGHIR